jgi:hypothetical protein
LTWVGLRSGNKNNDVLAGQLGEVELLLHVVDLDLDVGDGITSLDGGCGNEGGESLVGGLSSSGK